MKPVIAKLITLLVIAAMVTAVWGGVPAQGSTVAAISIPETDKENAVVLNIKLPWQELLVEQVVVEGKTFSRLFGIHPPGFAQGRSRRGRLPTLELKDDFYYWPFL